MEHKISCLKPPSSKLLRCHVCHFLGPNFWSSQADHDLLDPPRSARLAGLLRRWVPFEHPHLQPTDEDLAPETMAPRSPRLFQSFMEAQMMAWIFLRCCPTSHEVSVIVPWKSYKISIISQQIPQQETSNRGNFPEFSQIPTSPNISQQEPADPNMARWAPDLPCRRRPSKNASPATAWTSPTRRSPQWGPNCQGSRCPGTMAPDICWYFLRNIRKNDEKCIWNSSSMVKVGVVFIFTKGWILDDFSSEIVVWPPLNCWKYWE